MDDDHQSKRTRVEDSKRARLQRIMEEHAAHVNAVQFGGEEYHTVDDYTTDLDVENQTESLDLWADKDTLQFKDVPEDLWSDFNMERNPKNHLRGLDVLANEVEISRLLAMEGISHNWCKIH